MSTARRLALVGPPFWLEDRPFVRIPVKVEPRTWAMSRTERTMRRMMIHSAGAEGSADAGCSRRMGIS